jgi:hypothetical protein
MMNFSSPQAFLKLLLADGKSPLCPQTADCLRLVPAGKYHLLNMKYATECAFF